MAPNETQRARPFRDATGEATSTTPAVLVLAAACVALLLAYADGIGRRGALLEAWLGYLSPDNVPPARMFSGALWLFVLVELAAGKRFLSAHSKPALRVLVTSGFAGVMFYTLRDTRCELGDGPSLLRDPAHAVESGGYYTFIEELVGMWLPLRLARIRYLMNTPTSAAIVDGYRIVSIACGMAYAGAVARAAVNFAQPRRFAMLMFGHAALLLFTGYVENYVGAFTLLALGFLAAVQALRKGAVTPRQTLAVTFLFSWAVLFHGVAVWSVGALLVLALYTHTGHARWLSFARTALLNAALGILTLALVYVCFRYYVTPGVGPVHLRPLMAGAATLPFATSLGELSAVRSLPEHGVALLRVGCPGLLALIASASCAPRLVRAALRAPDVRFALAFLAGFLVHQLIWRSTLGTYRDWDLFGFTALPIAYLGARAVCSLPRSRLLFPLLFTVAVLAGLSWPLSQMGAALNPRDQVRAPWWR